MSASASNIPRTLNRISSTVSTILARVAANSSTASSQPFKLIPKLPSAPRTATARRGAWQPSPAQQAAQTKQQK
ncbi:hypothetical protein CAOG_008108 [Capsaspora owczarzaki ATCC 30864]|uniref:Uncharacterized protein n=1 Tax=Capsaspora owczarzaki (strain ATCC 30864) TaxID=595528 RepID=A0A0D2W1D1_CAPO3|nr:hypothetical protein CAOG_008108 [Capsaspora owczarzaki ATCC 30864]